VSGDRPEDRYPLTWPTGWPRTPSWKRSASPFKNCTTDKAYRELLDELGRLGARRILVSSNLRLRQDGAPYSQQPRNDDEGVAVYFIRKGKEMVLACDKFHKREDNMRAITKTIDAIRGIERWGSSDMMERAFTGFTALGHDSGRRWWDVLGVASDASAAEVESAYKRRRSVTHPDKGGDATEFAAVEEAYAAATKEAKA
jgi:hypothetical protein